MINQLARSMGVRRVIVATLFSSIFLGVTHSKAASLQVNQYVSSTVCVQAGDSINIYATGHNKVGDWAGDNGFVGPTGTERGAFGFPIGDTYDIVAEFPHAALLYRILNEEQWRSYFDSTTRTFTAPIAGCLEFDINDNDQENNDHNYALTVTVDITPAEPTPTVITTPTMPITATITPTITSTLALTATDTPTATPTPTATQPPTGEGDAYEANNFCTEARAITTDGGAQSHTFHRPGDEDWVHFDVTADVAYRIEVLVPDDSPADVVLELYPNCNALPTTKWHETFARGARLEVTAPVTSAYFLRVGNQDDGVGGDHVRYQLSVRPLSLEPTTGAVIIVAGRLRRSDPLQRNIHNVTNRVYQIFLAHGYTSDTITYLATDPALPGYDAPVTKENLHNAITQWGPSITGADKPLTLYLMDHGDRETFYLDQPNDRIVTPQELNEWLTAFEQAAPRAKINIILEACYIGSFIDPPNTISKPGQERVVVTSSDNNWSAYASRDGAHFSDHFLTALQQGRDLFSSFNEAQHRVNTLFHQTPWLDADGDGTPNEQIDYAIAAERSFAYVGTLSSDEWPPLIVAANGPPIIQNRRGMLTAEVHDDREVQMVWAEIYAPSYQPPTSAQELLKENLPTQLLTSQGDNRYAGEYPGFDEVGIYRIVFYAKDELGNLSLPVEVTRSVALTRSVDSNLFLPTLMR